MSRHPWDRTIREHRQATEALGNAAAAAVDVGRQRESIHQPAPASVRDDRRLCVACQNDPHEDGSDFCSPCRRHLAGEVDR